MRVDNEMAGHRIFTNATRLDDDFWLADIRVKLLMRKNYGAVDQERVLYLDSLAQHRRRHEAPPAG